MENRGSEWSIWDLHIHTPSSINQQYGDTPEGWEKFICALENLPDDVKVIGITDYYFIDGYEKVMDYKTRQNRLKNIDKIFPILEFRIDTFGTASESRLQKINLHILFNLDEHNLQRQIEKVKSEFIKQIPITKLEEHQTKMLSLENFTDVAEGDLQSGFSNFIPSTDKVFQLIDSTEWSGKTLLFLGYKEWSNLEKNQQLKPFKKNLYSKVNAFFSNNSQTNERNQSWLNEYGNKKLLHSLDIHGFDSLDSYEFNADETKKACEKYHCHTWIKAEPTFEGLKQIIYEPEERVKIQKEIPESEKLDNLMIKKVSFKSSRNRFTPKEIHFNKNLNVIIGGKSSGKSILLYEIARTLYPNTFHKDLVYKDTTDNKEKHLYDLREISNNEIDENYDFHVELFSGSSQSESNRESDSSILPSIKYIPQNHLSNLVDKSRKNGATLKKIIRDLIREDNESDNIYKEFLRNVKQNDNERNQDIDYYYELKESLEEKKRELENKGNIVALNEGVASNKNIIKELNKSFSQEERDEYESLTKKLNDLNIQENQIKSDFTKLDIYRVELKQKLTELSSKKKITIDSLQNESIKAEYSDNLNFVDTALRSVNEIAELLKKDSENKFIDNSIFATELGKINVEKEEVKKDLEPLESKSENQKQVTALQKSIKDDEAKISEITQFEKEVNDVKTAIDSQKKKIFEGFKENYNLYEKVIKDLDTRIKEVEDESDKIKIIPSIKYYFPKFIDTIEDVFNVRRLYQNKDFDYLYQNTNPKSALVDIDYDKIEGALEVMFSKIEKGELLPKKKNAQSDLTKKIFTDFFFDHWDVQYKGDDIHKMSTGKASFVLLQLIIKLSKEDSPILIDQPEDNLDNRSISKELVSFLKEKKKERQIILVTHNPNIVVNADAENIIVANQKGQNDTESESNYDFDYINGALENSFPNNGNNDLLKSMGIREHIAEIVEGGEIAFKKREEKYGFK